MLRLHALGEVVEVEEEVPKNSTSQYYSSFTQIERKRGWSGRYGVDSRPMPVALYPDKNLYTMA